jgi:hypothetical protein
MQYLKAVVGALVAGLGALATALADNAVAPIEWVTVASATLVALGAVWGVPNTVNTAKPATLTGFSPAPANRTVGGTGSNVTLKPKSTTGGYQGGDVAPPD